VPGFNPTNNGLRSIRGRTAQVFVNGVPVNEQLNATLGADLKLVRPDQLSGIEVSRGANSAYGFGSPGGIISLSTPRAQSEELELRTIVRESINPHRIGGSHQTSLYHTTWKVIGKNG
jgi:iron complex outermembrane recepter protein